MKNQLQLLLLCAIILIVGCTTRLATNSPAATDLSGTWLLDKNASQTVLISSSGRQGNSSGGERSGMGGSGMGGSGMGDQGGEGQQDDDEQVEQGSGQRANGPRRTPAMQSVEMSIEQNHDSMGIAYPNELYRDVDWGEKEFYRETVSAGWQENTLIVKTVSEQMTLTESYQLNSDKEKLTLTITIKDQRGTNEFVRLFNKKDKID